MPFLNADRIDYSPNPGGSTQQVQYNNDGTLSGASHVLVDDSDLVLSYSSSPSTPDTDQLKLYPAKLAGRLLPSVKPPVGSNYSLQPFVGQRRIQQLVANGESTTVTQIGTTVSTVGTATAAATASTNIHTMSKRVEVAVTVASTTAVAALRTAALQHFMGTSTVGGYFLVLRYGPSRGVSTATHRSFAGMWGSGSAPTDVNPSTLTDMIGFGYDGTGDTNIQFMHNDASGTAVKVDLGASFPKPTADTTKVYEAIIYCPPGGPDVYYSFTDLGTGAVVTGSVATELPATYTAVRPVIYNSVGGVSSVIGVSLMNLYLESSY